MNNLEKRQSIKETFELGMPGFTTQLVIAYGKDKWKVLSNGIQFKMFWSNGNWTIDTI